MSWIVLGEEKGKIKLVSKSEVTGILPRGSYLTVEQDNAKFILRVDDSSQDQPYSPPPFIIDMDLDSLKQDQKCQNIIYATRIKEINNRTDGLIEYLRPQIIARRSNQEEIDLAMSKIKRGPKIFPATVYASENQLLTDDKGKLITICLPEDMFFYQIMMCGKTGAGKTVAAKYLAQYFVEDLEGCVLAINVKEADFLRLYKESTTKKKSVQEEWKNLKIQPHGIGNFTIYHPANVDITASYKIDKKYSHQITLDVKKIDPEALIGLLRGITDKGAQQLTDIFRYWKNQQERLKNKEFTFNDFVQYFSQNDTREFDIMNPRGDIGTIRLHFGTYDNIQRNLLDATEFFDNIDAQALDESDILIPGKMSVIDVANGKNGIQFGSILLRDLLNKIVIAKDKGEYTTPILIIIDEVHQFYDDKSATAALGDLDVITRTGRSKKIGVIYSSQIPKDIPKGLSDVVNTKIFFKSDVISAKKYGINIKNEEMEFLKAGFAACSIYNMAQLKLIKFPLSLSGVFEED